MMFALGYIAGLATAAVVLAAAALFRSPIESAAKAASAALSNAGPRPRSAVYEPEDDADEVRRERIEENAKQGKDTPIGELL